MEKNKIKDTDTTLLMTKKEYRKDLQEFYDRGYKHGYLVGGHDQVIKELDREIKELNLKKTEKRS